MNYEELHVHIERALENLRREFSDKITAEHVTSIGNDRFARLVKDAKIIEFIPLLVYRETREALLVTQPDTFDREPTAPGGIAGHSGRRTAWPRPAATQFERVSALPARNE